MKGPKIVVIGAGSYFFGRLVIWHMIESNILNTGTLALVDTNPKTLKTMMDLAKRAISAKDSKVTLEGSTDRREVMKDADFVVLTFSERNTHFRGIDTEISKKHGIRMCSSDTIGPGGVFRALREIPHALAIAKDTEELAPDAWVINLVNPTTVMGIALMRYGNTKSFALCDGLHEPYNSMNFMKPLGILPEDAEAIPQEVLNKWDQRIAGVNHFTWLLKMEYAGKDLIPDWHKIMQKRAKIELEEHKLNPSGHSDHNSYSKAAFNANYSLDLFNVFGYYPDRISHTKEYVPYYQGYGSAPVTPEPILLFDAADRQKKMDEWWKQTEAWANGSENLDSFFEQGHADHATDIIESMWGGLGKQFYINTANKGAVTNMAEDAFLELRSHLTMEQVNPVSVGLMPRGILGLQQQVLDTHELTAQAAVEFDRDIVLRALATDPIVNNLNDARAVMDDLFKAQKDVLDSRWYT